VPFSLGLSLGAVAIGSLTFLDQERLIVKSSRLCSFRVGHAHGQIEVLSFATYDRVEVVGGAVVVDRRELTFFAWRKL
jgi:hypothetical protein